jgi:hypothetical protein
MAQFACIRLGTEIVRILEFETQPADIPHKSITWMPYVEATVNPPIIEADRVYKLTTIRNMTTQEINARDDAIKTEYVNRLDSDIIKAMGAIIFELVNKDRQRDGLQPLTANQFRNYVKSKL